MNIIYLLGSDPQGLEEISRRGGFRLTWNNERGCYEKVPTVSIDRLKNLSLGWAVILRQRMNPTIIRYYPFNRYGYSKSIGEMNLPDPHDLPSVTWFSMKSDFEQIKKGFNTGETNKLDRPKIQVNNMVCSDKVNDLMVMKNDESNTCHDIEYDELSDFPKKENLFGKWQREC